MDYAALVSRIKFWIDLTGSSRFETADYDNALNVAQLRFIDEQCGVYNKPRSIKGIQLTSNIRDSLHGIYKTYSSNSFATMPYGKGVPIPSSAPSIMRHLVGKPSITISSVVYYCDPVTYEEIPSLARNPYRSPRLEYPQRLYYYEGPGTADAPYFGFIYPGAIDPTVASLIYIKEPTGFTAGAGSLEVHVSTHETIAKYAAEALLTQIENWEKLKILRQVNVPE